MKNYFPCELKMDFLFGRVCMEGKMSRKFNTVRVQPHSIHLVKPSQLEDWEGKTCAELECVSFCLQLLFFVLLCTLKKKV